MMTGIPEWLVVAMLGVIGTVAWWGIRRIVSGQDLINQTLVQISDRLAHIDGRVGKVETRMEMHEEQEDDLHRRFDKEVENIWQQVRTISNHKRGLS